jgi:hypothetical protein
VFGLREDADPPTTPYSWALEAAPFIGPPLPSHVADNEALGVFDSRSFLAREVDTTLYTLHDYGVTADVDRYQGYILDYKVLQARQQQLD